MDKTVEGIYLVPAGSLQEGYKFFGIRIERNITQLSCTDLPISWYVINWLNKIGLSEGHPSLLIFYDRKVNPVGDDYNKTAGVYEVPDITVMDEETG